MGAKRARRSRWSRLWALWFAILVALVVPLRASAEAPPPPAPAGSGAPVRIGTTETTGAEPSAPETERAPPDPETHAPPGDAPRVDSALKIPPPPSSFNTHDGGWVKFAYEPSVRDRVQPLITEADGVRAELTRRLGSTVLRKVTVYVARTPGEMASLAPEGAAFPKYAAGVAYSDIGFVLLTIQPVDPNSHHDLSEVFRHELAHVALHDAVDGHAVPRWFNEGFAVFASGESSFTRIQTLWTATVADELLPLKRLERTFPSDLAGVSIAYAEAADVVRFLVRREDHQRFVGSVERMRRGQDFESALRDSYGIDLSTLEYEWREDVSRRYTFWPIVFSGSFVWALMIGLFFWAWRRRNARAKETLARWDREEAEDELKKRLREATLANGRVHIVLARTEPRPFVDVKPPDEGDVPKVEIDGRWHTLH